MRTHKKLNARVKKDPANLDKIINSLPTEGKGEILSDVNGSYTGTSLGYESPEQDADDL